MTEIREEMAQMGVRARKAATILATASADAKRHALEAAADAVLQTQSEILAANAHDLQAAREKGLSGAMLDRLLLDEARLSSIAQALRDIAAMDDPVGAVISEWDRPSGLHIRRVRTPLGVIGVIFESRPNVTADAGALCLKAGNAVILRGGSESFESSRAIHAALRAGLRAANLPEEAIQLVTTTDRSAVSEMLRMVEYIDVIVPRGGKGLVGLVQREARVPVFAHLEGICHVYVDASADRDKARAIVLNAKTRRTGICGAAECLLLHRDIISDLGAEIISDLVAAGVEVRAGTGLAHLPGTLLAAPDDFGKEFLDMVIAAEVVDGVDAAIAHVRTYGSQHTDCVIAEDQHVVERFFTELDSAILIHNASTQFADGGEFGLGAEIGIATGKMHARGPVGAEQLTSFKYLVTGDGTIRS